MISEMKNYIVYVNRLYSSSPHDNVSAESLVRHLS